MLASKLYSPTLRELPSDAVVMSHKYMLKAGMMRKSRTALMLICRWHSAQSRRLKTSSVPKSIKPVRRKS